MATYASKLRPSAVDGQTIRVLPDGRIRGNAGMEPFSAGTKGGAPSVFYVDGNVVSSGNGLGWLSAVKTLAEALVMAHAYMSTSGNKAWAHRATIYACGDNLTETLVLGAEKSDVIGVGQAGGFKTQLIGQQAPRTTSTVGMRWYNFRFGNSAGGSTWSLTDISSGIKFIDCEFAGTSSTQTYGLLLTACTSVEVAYCNWIGVFPEVDTNWSTAGIGIATGAGGNINIHDCLVIGEVGIAIHTGTTAVGGAITINNNVVLAQGVTIDDDSDLAIVTNNSCISLAAYGATAFDFNLALACNNVVTGSGDTKKVPIDST